VDLWDSMGTIRAGLKMGKKHGVFKMFRFGQYQLDPVSGAEARCQEIRHTAEDLFFGGPVRLPAGSEADPRQCAGESLGHRASAPNRIKLVLTEAEQLLRLRVFYPFSSGHIVP